MATGTSLNCIEQIGETAGKVWLLLDENGPMPISKIAKEVDGPRDIVLQAIGWLAREDKVLIEEERRKRIVALRVLH